jgi:beta-mannosidase
MISIHEGRTKLNLGGVWKYKLDEDNTGEKQGYTKAENDFSSWKDMKIPNNWYLTEVGDYFGTVWFQTNFKVPSDYNDKKLFLRFGAVDYYADVYLNGEYLGSHEGMFNPFEFDVTDKLNLKGDNVLVVRDGAPLDETEYIQADFSENPLSNEYKRHQAKAITQIKGHMIDSMHKNGAMTKHRQAGNTGGIWDDVELIARPDIYVDYVKIFTKVVLKKDWLGDKLDKPDGSGLVSADVTIINTTGKVVKTDVNMTITPYNFDEDVKHDRIREVVLQPGSNTFKIVITVPNAKLWWTWDHGRPDMYTATVAVADDKIKQNFGIKEVVHDEKTEQWYLNGKRIFIRGMRYISSNWMSEANKEMWTEDLTKMLDFDINSIRIGSHVEKDGFYTMCDEMGFLVWQVFPLHYCVSDSDDFIERASEMIKDMGLMLCNHASMGMWSVFKEPEIYLLPDKPNNYHRLCKILKETLGTVDPERWIHLGDYREGAQNIMIGLCQPGDLDLNKTQIKSQIVEFGAGSIPCLETLKTFIPEDKLWPPDWDTWEYWGLFYNLTFKFAKIEMGNSLEEFIDNYQTYEALVVKEQIEYLRQRKYQPVASMYLYYWSDACPIIGSGLLDYYRRPYKVYDSMKSVYQRVLISLEWNADPYVIGREKFFNQLTTFTAKVWVNNDFNYDVEDAKISWKIVKIDTDEVVAKNNFTSTLPEDSIEAADHIVWQIPDGAAGKYRVDMEVTTKTGEVLCSNSTDITVR